MNTPSPAPRRRRPEQQAASPGNMPAAQGTLPSSEPARRKPPQRRTRRARTAARAITVPTMLIRGAQSDVVSHEGARDLLELIPGARQVDVGGAGHMVSGDDNDLLSEGLLEFLTVIPEQPNR